MQSHLSILSFIYNTRGHARIMLARYLQRFC